MQAIILAAGESSRFYPFNDLHKSMIKIMGKTILEHTLISIKKTGIKNVIIVATNNNKIKELFGDGGKLGLNIKYVVQAEATGMGDALLLAEKYIKSDFFLLHAHHVDFHKFKDLLENKKIDSSDIVLLAKKITDPLLLQKMGVLKIEEEKVIDVVEKPFKGTKSSDLGIIGIYLLNKSFVENLKKIPKEHYNFEKSISYFAEKANVRFAVTDIDNVSLKYPWDILGFKDNMFSDLKKYIANSASVASSQISGEVYIDENAKVMENATIKGPCYIGKNAYVGNNSILRGGVDLGENSVIGANMEFKNTLMMENSKVHSGFIGDSVIGKNCRIGAGFNTANVRLDRTTVKAVVKNEKIDTGQKSLGVMIGEGTRIGIKSSSMPGIIIGRKATIGSNTVVMENVPDDTKYYTKFQKVIIKK